MKDHMIIDVGEELMIPDPLMSAWRPPHLADVESPEVAPEVYVSQKTDPRGIRAEGPRNDSSG